MSDKVLRLLGLATNAGKVITGIELAEKAVKNNKAKLIVLTRQTKASTSEIFAKSKLPVVVVENNEVLGKFTGKDFRSVAVVTDKGFAEAILKESEEGKC